MVKYIGDFTVISRELGESKEGARYIKMKVSGPQGNEIAYCYYNIDEYMNLLEEYDVVSIDGFRITRGTSNLISVKNMRKNINAQYREYLARYNKVLEHVTDPRCCDLHHKITDHPDVYQGFLKVPASLNGHHAYIGGLMVHTVEAMEMGLKLCKSPSFKDKIDLSTLMLGLFLHDIGKTICYEVRGYEMTMTDRCLNIGHVDLGFELLARSSHSYCRHSDPLHDKLGNIILSHHTGSRVKPKSLEAELVRHIDNLSAGLGAMELSHAG